MQIASAENLRGGAVCFMWATFPNIAEAIKVLEAWGFVYKTAAFVWIKKNRENGGNFWGMGADTRANAEGFPGAGPQSPGPPGDRGPF